MRFEVHQLQTQSRINMVLWSDLVMEKRGRRGLLSQQRELLAQVCVDTGSSLVCESDWLLRLDKVKSNTVLLSGLPCDGKHYSSSSSSSSNTPSCSILSIIPRCSPHPLPPQSPGLAASRSVRATWLSSSPGGCRQSGGDLDQPSQVGGVQVLAEEEEWGGGGQWWPASLPGEAGDIPRALRQSRPRVQVSSWLWALP